MENLDGSVECTGLYVGLFQEQAGGCSLLSGG